ncbi:hypothetical protein FRC03_001588 [Tulasnella sp. 419]|nr:hypothetical protein FRC02_000675 [Tulasnella sp. 418]KAG8945973.1 hypothetical protein FRC03_001588 [Tulasnella sp. 419]
MFSRNPFLRKGGSVFLKTVQWLCAAHLFTEYIGRVGVSFGASMLPTFSQDINLVLLECFSHRYGRISRGDIVVATKPTTPDYVICKRVIGLPGDTVCIDPMENPPRHVVIPRGHVWLQGDNMFNSTDSRHYGPVPVGLLQGKVIARLWPFPFRTF